MAARNSAGGAFPWVVAVVVALVVVAGIVALLQLPPEPVVSAPTEAPRVELARIGTGSDAATDQTLRAEVALLDPRPLFLPTERNAGRADALADDGRREPAASFQNFPPQLVYGEENVSIEFPAPVTVPQTPVGALRTLQGKDALGSLGRRDGPVVALPRRAAFLEVTRAGSGGVALRVELGTDTGFPAADWDPAELVAAVGPAGLVGTPVLTASSGSDLVDGWLPAFLAGKYRLGERLEPGFYRVRVGP